MVMKRMLLQLCATAAFCFLISGGWAIDPMELAPKQAEVVAHIDVKAVLKTPQFDIVMKEFNGEMLRSQAKNIQTLTDFDVFNDLSDVYLFSRIDDEASTILAARGNFNQEKLLSLVKLNKTYNVREADGVAIHNWQDKGDKYAAFFEPGLLVFAGSREAMDAVFEARRNKEASFLGTPNAGLLPSDLGQSPIWVMLIHTPWVQKDFGQFSRAIDLDFLLLRADLKSETVAARLLAYPAKPELMDDYLKAAIGGLAVADLLREEQPIAGLLAKSATADKSPDGRAIQISAEVPSGTLLDVLRKRAF